MPRRPANQCVYCLSHGGEAGLSTEHTYPFFLGASIEFPKASCSDCADKTKRFEQVCARQMFGPLRIVFNLPTRRRRDRPTELPVVVELDGNSREELVPVADYPSPQIIFPLLPEAGALVAAEPRDEFAVHDNETSGLLLRDHNQRLARLRQRFGPAARISTPSFCPIPEFCRLLAKIVHCEAVAMHGFDSFEPLLPDYILGRNNRAAYLVGRAPPAAVAAARAAGPLPQGTHPLTFNLLFLPNRTLLVGLIQIVREMDSPMYAVAAGVATPALVERIRRGGFQPAF